MPTRRPTGKAHGFSRRSYATFLRGVFPRRLTVPSSILPEIAIQLPLTHLPNVLLPLFPLRLEESLVDVRAEGVADDIVFFEHLERLVQVARQLVDPILAPLPEAHREDVLAHRIGWHELPLDPVAPPPA